MQSEGDMDPARRESSVDMDLDGTSEGYINRVPDHCVDGHIAQRHQKRAKTVGAPNPVLNRNKAITPRLSK